VTGLGRGCIPAGFEAGLSSTEAGTASETGAAAFAGTARTGVWPDGGPGRGITAATLPTSRAHPVRFDAVATQQECETALTRVAQMLSGADPRARSKLDQRTLSCLVRDLDLLYLGRLVDGALGDVQLIQPDQRSASPAAQLRLTVASDDLVLLSRKELDFTKAWLSGRVKLEASIGDLIKLKSML
jgi:hypothetical protein